MIRAQMTYGAAAVKARAMWAKCLTDSQWEQLASPSGLWAVREILLGSPGWQTVESVQQGEMTAQRLTQALEAQLERDLHALCHFLPKADRAEVERFYRALDRGMEPEEFQRWWASLGKGNAALRRLAGAEADGLNLVYILRLRRFPVSLQKAEEHLIPVRAKLRKDTVAALLRARSDNDALAVLAGTSWGKTFTSLAPVDLEKQYRAYMRSFCGHLLASGQPGLGAVLAVLVMKHDQLLKLRQVIGAVEQGIDPRLVL